ncbi:hypothetical protein [Sporolactobacillus pectinivorans]|uniref:hypothetical protein n=1 Tax=Sporolactobacillus pectinivorans TaxID=1591408 RepID=UPI001876A6FB|nr:hypothetical protein [Sporolactobacillus pectinivorans]
MKKILIMLVGVLVVIGGLLFLFNYNQSSPRGHSETASSQKVEVASRHKSAAASSASSSSAATNVPASSSLSPASSSSISTGSSQPASSSSSTSVGLTSTNTSSSSGTVGQVVNRPQGAWVKTFEKNFYREYHLTPSRYVYFGDGIWGVWVKEFDTGYFPEVTVDQKGTINPASKPQGAWVKTFEKDLYRGYHVTPDRYVYIGRGYWEVWVKGINTGEYPYVTVNQYTGNFHG